MKGFEKKPERPADAKPGANADKPSQVTKIPDNLKVGGNLDQSGKPKTFRDAKTGREILTKPPHSGFPWKEGHVLRSVTHEAVARGFARGGATVGGDWFEWVPVDEVEIEESK